MELSEKINLSASQSDVINVSLYTECFLLSMLCLILTLWTRFLMFKRKCF